MRNKLPALLLAGWCAASLAATRAAAAPPKSDTAQLPHGQTKPPGPALSPQEAMAKMELPPGFKMEVVASEPDVVNPTSLHVRRPRADLGDRIGRVSAQDAGAGAGPGQDPGVDEARRPLRQGHDLQGRPEHPLRRRRSATAASTSPTRRTCCSSRTPTATARPTSRRSSSPASAGPIAHELPNSLTWGPDGWLYGMNGVFNRRQGERPGDGQDLRLHLRHLALSPADQKVRAVRRRDQQPVGPGLQPPGRLVRLLLRDRSPVPHDPERLLPPPGRPLSAADALAPVDHDRAPPGGRLRGPVHLRRRRLPRGISRHAAHGQPARQRHQPRRPDPQRLHLRPAQRQATARQAQGRG